MEIFKEKYYTPEIEEFHVGFEYEYLTNGDEWVKHIINNKADLIDCIEDIKESKIRVKYLDKEDIESLGFKYSEGYTLDIYKKDNKTIRYDPSDNHMTLEETIDERNGNILFIGKVKNISEFKKVLKDNNIK